LTRTGHAGLASGAPVRCSLNEGEIRDQAAAVVGSVICFTSVIFETANALGLDY
jgi:short subunit fatty acids transporter